MSNTKLFYTYRDSSDGKEKLLKALSAYSDSLIFDEDNRRIWHRGHQYGNSYWGSYHGETFNDFKSNTASGDYSHAEGSHTTATRKYSHAEGLYTNANGEAAHAEGNSTTAKGNYSHAEGAYTKANEQFSHAEGLRTIAGGEGSHAEGIKTVAIFSGSHAEGAYTKANEQSSHAEGEYTVAWTMASHAEGYSTKAGEFAAHAEGLYTNAEGIGSHSEGAYTYAVGSYSHAGGIRTVAHGESSCTEGYATITYGNYSHAEGNSTIANGNVSHTEGYKTIAYGNYSHTEGDGTEASGISSHAEGSWTKASGDSSHAEGSSTESNGPSSHAEGSQTKASGEDSHAEGLGTIANGSGSHSEGHSTQANGEGSHAEGYGTIASGEWVHAEGDGTEASGPCSHSEGHSTKANGMYSHAEGDGTEASGEDSHAEGHSTKANGMYSHAEGDGCTASGEGSHAEGFGTLSHGDYSHSQGYSTVAYNNYEAAFGEFNESLNEEDISRKTVFSIGDGTDNETRHNIIDFRKNGDMHKNGNSFFHDNIYGPVSNTYVESLGESATLDIVLSSLLTQPEYTRPNITVKYSHSGNIEIGTYITPTITLEWPERTEHTNGTRAYTLENGPTMPNYLLGYSYGIKSIQISYNNGSKFKYSKYSYTYTGNGLNTYGLDTPLECNMTACYILDEGVYYLFKDLEVSYLASSYMYFQQLYDKGVYVYAYGLPPKNWIETGYATINGGKNNYVTGGLQFYYGFSGDTMNPDNNLPLDITKNSYKGWLPSSFSPSIKEVQTTALGSINAAKYCFWVAYPDTDDINDTITNKHYKLIANSDKFKIEVLMKDGMNFDLVSPDQPLKSTMVNVQIGNMNKTIRYKIAYVDFQNPIGNVNNILKFTIATKTGAGEAII